MEFQNLEIFKSFAEKQERMGLFIPFCLLISILECFFVYMTFQEQIGIINFFLLHLILSGACLAFLMFFTSLQYDIRFPLLLTLFFSCLGPLGALMTLFIGCMYIVESKLFENDSSLMAMFFPDFGKRKSSFLYDRITYGMEDIGIRREAVAYQDVMTFGSDNQKRQALEKIGRYFRPEFVPALHIALNDPSTTIRIHAGTTLTHLETKFDNQYVYLENLLKSHPNDLKYLLAYAQHCEKYVKSKILSSDRATRMKRLAVDAYEHYLNFYPNELSVLISLSFLYLDLENYEKSKQYIDRIFLLSKNLPAKVYLLLVKIFYEQKKYEELNNLSKQKLSFDVEDPDVEELNTILALWKQDENKTILEVREVSHEE